ncbi:hypothetical protein BOX15_Mlig016672g2 [Macrostomum lignano]|uniref:Profilin n=1 Tax=Macrostomum lignano TaxID=282301 RepID=A0A267DY74_9PLAT|nr:hypothetical protein BOX15_Mlig016672g2 [Macrostomum lignano]
MSEPSDWRRKRWQEWLKINICSEREDIVASVVSRRAPRPAPVLWGSTADPDSTPTESELRAILFAFLDPHEAYSAGLSLHGRRYRLLRAEPGLLFGRCVADDDYMYCLMAVNSALLVSFSTLEMAPYCEAVVQRAACYLHENSY